MKILIIEDDPRLLELLRNALRRTYITDVASSLKEAQSILDLSTFDCIIADYHLPDGTTGMFLDHLHQKEHVIPTIILTGDETSETLTTCYTSGADDYMRKPFNTDELLHRIAAVTRRYRPQNNHVLKHGSLSIDCISLDVHYNSKRIPLRRKESEILALLMEHADRLVTRSHIWGAVWTSDREPFSNSVDVHIKRLRTTLKEFGVADIEIRTEIAKGYVLTRKEVV
jgi:DNA-binding response OmpR family regulator